MLPIVPHNNKKENKSTVQRARHYKRTFDLYSGHENVQCDAMWIYPPLANTGTNCTCVYEPAVSSFTGIS